MTQHKKAAAGKSRQKAEYGPVVYCLPCRPGFLYVNVTDSCLNSCLFCIKRDGPHFYGCNLSLGGRQPDAAEIMAALTDNPAWSVVKEVVICGMGEPLLRYDCVREVCDAIRKAKGNRTSIRVDTSGLFWAQDKRLDILERIDILSVSLNAETAEKYQELCHPKIERAYEILLDFLRAVKAAEASSQARGLPFPEVRLSVVDTREEVFIPASGRAGYAPGKFPVPNYEKCREIADGFGWQLIVKRLFRDSRDERWNDRELLKRCARGFSPDVCRACSYRH